MISIFGYKVNKNSNGLLSTPDGSGNPFFYDQTGFKKLFGHIKKIATDSRNKETKKAKTFGSKLLLEISYFCQMETNRQKKIGALLQNDLVSILQGEIRKNNINNLVISVSKVNVTSDLSIAKVHLSVFPTEKAGEILAAVKSNAPLIKHDLSQRVKNQLRKVPNLIFYIDDSLDYIEKIDKALTGTENPIENPDLLEKRKKS